MNTINANEAKKFLEESVAWLVAAESGCCKMDLPNGLSIAVGWMDGFDPKDKKAITQGTYGLVCAVCLNTSKLYCDFDADFTFIHDKHGFNLAEEYIISPEQDYTALTTYLIQDYNYIDEYEWNENGLIK